MKQLRFSAITLSAALVVPAIQIRALPQVPSPQLAEAYAALQEGEADKALELLKSAPAQDAEMARARNLECRVRYSLEQWDAAATNCEQAVRLDAKNADFHLWLGRTLGEKADRASFLTAYSLAKRVRDEFEQAVQLNPRDPDALSDLGEYYRQAPQFLGGGVEKAEGVAIKLDGVDAARAHELRGHIAAGRKDYGSAEREYKLAISTAAHPALQWITLASFYHDRQRLDDMESAIHNAVSGAHRDIHAGVALYDGASVLARAHRNLELAATMLQEYLASPSKSEEAPAFVAHVRLARIKQQLGDHAAANRERAAALALAHDYKPAQDLNPQDNGNQEERH